MVACSFERIYQEIQQANSLTSKQKNRLLLFINYLHTTRIELLKNITPKRIFEVTKEKESEKDVVIDIFYFLCGNQWPVLKPIYRYIDDYCSQPIEIEEEELADIRESGHIMLNNGNIRSKFNPAKLFITFTLSEFAINLKNGDL